MKYQRKFPIEWHQESLTNWERTLYEMEAKLAIMQAQVEDSRKKVEFYKFQIQEALKRNLKEFDSDKLLVSSKRNP